MFTKSDILKVTLKVKRYNEKKMKSTKRNNRCYVNNLWLLEEKEN